MCACPFVPGVISLHVRQCFIRVSGQTTDSQRISERTREKIKKGDEERRQRRHEDREGIGYRRTSQKKRRPASKCDIPGSFEDDRERRERRKRGRVSKLNIERGC